jgi:spoIIIJ-associated protein
VSTALKNQGHEYWRVNVDIAGYKQQRADRLAEKAQAWIDKVKTSGEAMELQPMNAADRRIVHKIADETGLTTESIGEGRERRVVLKPATEEASQ